MSTVGLCFVILKGANLQGVKMLCCNAEGASLKGCNFEDPSGLKANLEGTSITASCQSSTHSHVPPLVWPRRFLLSGANLKGVDMEGSQMTGINLRVATLKNAKLKNCNLRGATLAGTDLEVNTGSSNGISVKSSHRLTQTVGENRTESNQNSSTAAF